MSSTEYIGYMWILTMITKQVWNNTSSFYKCINHIKVGMSVVSDHTKSMWHQDSLVEVRDPLLEPAVLTGCSE